MQPLQTVANPDSASLATSVTQAGPMRIPTPDSVVNYGKLFLNAPYRYGGTGASSFDCSGFTSFVYRNFGYELEHSSAEQAEQFAAVGRRELQQGDLVYFSGRRKSHRVGHVGMVVEALEDGKFNFIHASTQSGVIISSSDEPYYSSRYIKANRVINGIALNAGSTGSGNVSGTSLAENADENQVQSQPDVIRKKKTIPARYHTVKSGETLSEIAEKYGLSVTELKKKNKLKGTKLSLKQKLKVKDAQTITEIVQVPAASHNQTVGVADAKTHTVQRGESLFSIARQYNLSVDELKNLNHITGQSISTGQRIIISQNNTIAAKSVQSDSLVASAKADTHRVVRGESLFSIAKKYQVPVETLRLANGLKSNSLHAGQVLRIAAGEPKSVDEPKTSDVAEVEAVETDFVAEPQVVKESARKNEIAAKQARLNHQNQIKSEKVESSSQAALPHLEPGTRIINHKVHAGESLLTLARDFKVSVDELKSINNLAETRLQPGQEIIILISPSSARRHAEQIASQNRELSSDADVSGQSAPEYVSADKEELGAGEGNVENAQSEKTYVVRRGETLSSVARKFGMSVAKLKEINKLESNSVSYGKKLRISPNSSVSGSEVERPATTEVAVAKTSTYKVRKGDNLNLIAAKYNVSVDELKEMNGLSSNRLSAGQLLKVAGEYGSANSPTESSQAEYTVKKGDNLGNIAAKYRTSVDQLRKINNLTSNAVQVGQILKLGSSNATVESKGTETNYKQHQVAKGESLYTIAQQYEMTVEELKSLNGMSDSKLSSGQKLKVADKSSVSKSSAQKADKPVKSIQHKVKSGESLYSIAQKYGCSVNDLKEWNPGAGRRLDIGDVLVVNRKI